MGIDRCSQLTVSHCHTILIESTGANNQVLATGSIVTSEACNLSDTKIMMPRLPAEPRLGMLGSKLEKTT